MDSEQPKIGGKSVHRIAEAGRATRFTFGNPGGGRPRKTPLTDQLREAFSSPAAAASLAKAAIKAARRNPAYFKEILDRVEGKLSDRLEISGHLDLAERMEEARKRVTDGK